MWHTRHIHNSLEMHPPQYCPHVLDLQVRRRSMSNLTAKKKRRVDRPRKLEVDLRQNVSSKKTYESKLVSQSKGKRLWYQKHGTMMVEAGTHVFIRNIVRHIDLWKISKTKKKYKSKSVTQSRGKHKWNQKHNSFMEAVRTRNLKHFVYED